MTPKTRSTPLKRNREAVAADSELQDTPSRRTRQKYKASSERREREPPQPLQNGEKSSVLEVQEGLRRKRGRPRKIAQTPSSSLEKTYDTTTVVSTPAPILTSGRKQGRPRKSVPQIPSSPSERKKDDLAKSVSKPTSLQKPAVDAANSVSAPTNPSSRVRYHIRNSSSKPEEKGPNEFVKPIPTPTQHEQRTDDLRTPTPPSTAPPVLGSGRRRKTTPEFSVPREVGGDIEDSLQNAATELRCLLETDSSGSFTTLKAEILKGITRRRRLPLVKLEQEYQELHKLVKQTVLAGEGNSVMIIGSRGTAKTTMVETVIADLASDHRDVFHVIRLNGFIHTDDKLALREIWRQLGREMEIKDDSMGIKGNYADTLTSLLALLSHPAQDLALQPDQAANSVIFILDEFELFASHPRQTLLYNLFDVAQSRSAPILVIGVTTKVEVVNSLEKRVKSRFGQRYIHLSLPRTLASFTSICQSALIPSAPTSIRFTPAGQDFRELLTAWTKYIEALFENDANLQRLLETIYAQSKSVPDFLTAALFPIHQLTPSTLLSFTNSPRLLPPDSRLHLLPSLSDTCLALLISAARFHIAYESEKINFNMAYHEYVELAGKVKAASSAAGQSAVAGGTRILGRWVARGMWEQLVELELIVPAGGEGLQQMFRVDVALEEIAPSVPGLGSMMAKWCKEI